MNKNFVIEDDILTKYNGKDKIVKIPEGVKIIEYSCFENNLNIKKVILPSSCKTIEEKAFFNCANLEKIELCNVETIAEDAFAKCNNLKTIEIPETLKYINCIFEHCCNLEKIKFNKKYSEEEINCLIGTNNPNLEEIIGPNILCENGVVYNENKNILISYLESKKDKEFKLPEEVVKINSSAIFKNNYIETIKFNDNLRYLSECCIHDCKNLKEIIFNKNIEEIGFFISECENLKYLDLSKTKIRIYNDDYINEGNVEMTIKLPNNIETIFTNKNSKVTILNYNSNVKVYGPAKNIKQINLENLINEGKSFHEANKIIKEYER